LKRWIGLAAVLTAGALATVGSVTPAAASEVPTVNCRKPQPPRMYRLEASAEYTDSDTTGLRTWSRFRFFLHGDGPDVVHNNVNIRMSESGTSIYAYDSPDNLMYNRWYTVVPSSPVRTHLRGPNGERDHVENAAITFEAIFDVAGLDDPSCTATALSR
jgi:hypothetical protein